MTTTLAPHSPHETRSIFQGRQFNARSTLRLNDACQVETEIMLLGLRHRPSLRQRTLSERYHTQSTELTLTSIQANQTLSDVKYSSVGITSVLNHAASTMVNRCVPHHQRPLIHPAGKCAGDDAHGPSASILSPLAFCAQRHVSLGILFRYPPFFRVIAIENLAIIDKRK